MVNFDGLWELRFYYTSTLTTSPPLDHVLKFDINVVSSPDVGEIFEGITVEARDTSTQPLSDFTDAFMTLLRPCYSADAEFSRSELWFITEGTLDATFYSVYELALAGTNAGANTLSQQTTFTFRSQAGGTGRIQLMESAFSGSLRQSPPFASAQANALSNYVIAAACPILARDNSPFIARIHQCDGQNEIIWRKRNRL